MSNTTHNTEQLVIVNANVESECFEHTLVLEFIESVAEHSGATCILTECEHTQSATLTLTLANECAIVTLTESTATVLHSTQLFSGALHNFVQEYNV